MNSREYAAKLRSHADELDALPEFDTPDYFGKSFKSMTYFYEKDVFVSAVRALGTGTKEIRGDKMIFHPRLATFWLEIERSAVCKMTKPAEWSCEPWLTDEQQVVVDTAAAETSDEGIPF